MGVQRGREIIVEQPTRTKVVVGGFAAVYLIACVYGVIDALATGRVGWALFVALCGVWGAFLARGELRLSMSADAAEIEVRSRFHVAWVPWREVETIEVVQPRALLPARVLRVRTRDSRTIVVEVTSGMGLLRGRAADLDRAVERLEVLRFG